MEGGEYLTKRDDIFTLTTNLIMIWIVHTSCLLLSQLLSTVLIITDSVLFQVNIAADS